MFYSMTIPADQVEEDKSIRAIVTVLEGRGTRSRIDTELKYVANSEWDRKVKRISSTQFLIVVPSVAVLKLYRK